MQVKRGVRVTTVALAVLLAWSTTSCGDGSSDAGAPAPGSARLGTVDRPRLIEIEMSDFAFTPDRIEATAGETVTLRFRNTGTVRHEAVIGSEQVQEMHEREMEAWYATSVPEPAAPATSAPASAVGASFDGNGTGAPALLTAARHPGMSAPNVVSVEVGATGEVTYSLSKPARLLIGCHEPQHFEQGMVATLEVR